MFESGSAWREALGFKGIAAGVGAQAMLEGGDDDEGDDEDGDEGDFDDEEDEGEDEDEG